MNWILCNSKWVNSAFVAEVRETYREHKKPRVRWELYGIDGKFLGETQEPFEPTDAIVPAVGFVALAYVAESNWVDRQPIVAWRIRQGFVTPVLLDEALDAEKYAIGCPDGRVMMPAEGEYGDEVLWLEEMKKRAHAKAEAA